MIISLVKRMKGSQFTDNLESKYHSIENLEKIVDKTNNMKLLVDLDNWKYYHDNPDATFEEEFVFISDNLSFNEIDYAIISTIKSAHPKSIRALSNEMGKNISTIQPHVKKLEKEGIIHFEKRAQSNIPLCDFDAIKIEF